MLPTHVQTQTLVQIRGGELVTDSLTIAREFGRRHGNVLRTLDSLVADGAINQLNFELVEYVDAKGEKRRMVELSERGALIAMPFIGGRRAREGQARLVDAFLTLRTQVVTPMRAAAAIIPQTLAEALRLAADMAERTTMAETALAIATPKAEALDRLSVADGSMCVTDAAKALKVPPRKLFAWLDANRWTYRRNGGRPIAYQDALHRGVLEHRISTVPRDDGTDKAFTQVRVTAKGMTELASKLSAAWKEGGAC